MTEPQASRPRRRRPSAVPIVGGSLAAFMALFGFLTYQLRIGHDPALGAKTVAAAPAPKRVLVKRLERHVIVTTVVPPKEESDDGGSQPVQQVAVAQPATVQQPVVVQAPAAAPAPAPTSAPVVTRSS